jgi:hypothetical protein
MKLIGLISIFWFWLATISLLVKWPRDPRKSISQHSASLKSSYVFYTPAQVIAGVLLLIFMTRWFIPTFNLSGLYTLVISFTIGTQLVAAFLPDTIKGAVSFVHQIFAYGMALGMLVYTLLVILSPHLSNISRIFATISVLYMIFGLLGLIFTKWSKLHYLVLQFIYISLFLATILVATYSTKI